MEREKTASLAAVEAALAECRNVLRLKDEELLLVHDEITMLQQHVADLQQQLSESRIALTLAQTDFASSEAKANHLAVRALLNFNTFGLRLTLFRLSSPPPRSPGDKSSCWRQNHACSSTT